VVPEGAIVAILGNKSDLADKDEDIDQWRNEGFLYFRTSAVTGEAVKEAFRAVANEIQNAIANKPKQEPQQPEIEDPIETTEGSSRCC
jgi:hypothetical protein